ncbi:MAG: NUDIX hydrolase [Anaeromicrobium sp.]|jgi:8-oxo-dGTP pyrophosphatase MutT (NUDIX family)|uniref:NUDIX hydrolase n=1 Tax=Anaeromicrobium sp. TaxID=1929132 RepID=UPI0025FA1AD5|nr:NUDIX hydrolase [Anaeromicrobium sp.]MCT4593381.1 NUDIX hydrolase [Anaeromicrobium sp.]
MLFRNCAGGVVFSEDKVLLLRNEKNEWILPKGVIRNGNLSCDVAIDRVREETGVDAEIVSSVGDTCYEFFSISRQKPVCNEINWYLMRALNEDCVLNKELDFIDVGFFKVDKALDMITYSQDKSLVRLSYNKFKSLIVQEIMV